ncbi:hypothetical protein P12x_000355 [Tundrisphaera lichenicola]|uniref:hypothetical protein n=1 Tax=Tundrisphaera lichenicola TaxID=2029860 RepID=UPI003EB9E32F
MRRHHNPRYAPEALERKLSPSGIVAIPVAAEIYIPTTRVATTNTSPPVVKKDPIPTDPSNPVPIDTTTPTSPAPPSGDGTPPISSPSGSGGTSEPA